MKKRICFVSNSSSANFIAQWRYRSLGDEHTITEALSILFDVRNLYDKESDEVKWDKTYNDHEKMFEHIIKKSTINTDGSFTTSFFTSMFNDYEDFGTEALTFIFALVVNSKFDLIDTELEDAPWN